MILKKAEIKDFDFFYNKKEKREICMLSGTKILLITH